MSKEKQLYEILKSLQRGEIGTEGAHILILKLFSVWDSCNKYHKVKNHHIGGNVYVKQCEVCKLIIT